MKFAVERPYADPEKAARKLVEIANSVEAVQDGRIYIELINGPFLFGLKATPDEFLAGLNLAIERGWLTLDRSGTYVKFTATSAELFAWWQRLTTSLSAKMYLTSAIFWCFEWGRLPDTTGVKRADHRPALGSIR
jgi:hypothetical protein